ncbi:MAG: hypothetical protein ACR2RF_05925 [Geminicoccaceae bacterium]
MAVQKKVGPVPPEIFNRPQAETAGLEWFTNMIAIIEAQATTANSGNVGQTAAVADLNQTISNPPTQAEVQAISDKIDEFLAAQRVSGQLET